MGRRILVWRFVPELLCPLSAFVASGGTTAGNLAAKKFVFAKQSTCTVGILFSFK